MIYRFRAILDTEEDVFRDIEIESNATLEDLHNVINQSFGFDGQEMASFYLSDDQWQQGDEFSLFDMSEGDEVKQLMNDYTLESLLGEKQTRLLYVYDFFFMWRFMVELADIGIAEDGKSYPNLMFVHGQIPAEAPDIAFENALDEDTSVYSDDEDDDGFDDYDTYEDLDY